MNRIILTASLSLLLAGALSAAAGATIQLKKGRNEKAFDIQAETVSGVIWESARGTPGTRIRLWELNDVIYDGSSMDQFNALSRKLAGGRSAKLRSDAQSFKSGKTPTGFDDKQWARLSLSLDYFIAMADYFDGDWQGAVSGLEGYIKNSEKAENLYDQGGVVRASFKSEVSGKQITNAGGLNRFYLDALEALGLAYLKQGDAKQANAKAFVPLQNLTEELAKNSGDSQYFDWGIRALRASADSAQEQQDFKGARESYEALARVALKKNAGRPSRTSYEAQLKVGFMQIKEGDTRGAAARFYEAVRSWENDHKVDRPWQPRNDWIDRDIAYLTAGSYLGQGLVKAADAKRVEDWGEALTSFSTSLSIFNADDEVRSMALLGAANAAAQLAEFNKDKLRDVKDGDKTKKAPVTSDNYARLAEKYLSELTTVLPKSKAAEDKSIADIQALISKHRRD